MNNKQNRLSGLLANLANVVTIGGGVIAGLSLIYYYLQNGAGQIHISNQLVSMLPLVKATIILITGLGIAFIGYRLKQIDRNCFLLAQATVKNQKSERAAFYMLVYRVNILLDNPTRGQNDYAERQFVKNGLEEDFPNISIQEVSGILKSIYNENT